MIAIQNHPILPPPAKVDISLLLKPQDEEEASPMNTGTTPFPPVPSMQLPPMAPIAPPSVGLATQPSVPSATSGPALTAKAPVAGTKRLQPAHTAESPAKKQSKWSPEEDALIIELRGSGMKWEDISKRLPGRSAISCRLHYQNYLERRSEWDEDKKNKLARLYERFKAEMWSKVAEEMAIPWRAAEAMHWQLGEQEMARRAGVVPFSLSSQAIDPPMTRTRRASTSLSRPRKGSASRSIHLPHQLPSVQELTAGVPAAGVPAYAPPPPYPPMPPRDAYRIAGLGPGPAPPLDLARGHPGHMGASLGMSPRTLP
ncbi:MYB DNA-binding domain protein [Aspergillus undulatus]|uniref:MYB DNA-binding domain protein n=1 Tax=Aspergillus undulatus TaxID=1810928 RepID=UPI003CCD7285